MKNKPKERGEKYTLSRQKIVMSFAKNLEISGMQSTKQSYKA